MSNNENKKNLINLIKNFSPRYSTWEVFSDFIEMSAISISNAIDKTQFTVREEKYLQIIKKYEYKERMVFPKMFGELTMALEKEMTDVLGEIFMELNLGSKWKGQVFTPFQVCRAMAAMSLTNIEENIEKNGFITLSEPACGGGALVIAIAENLMNLGYNYQKVMKVDAIDLDIKSVHMSYIQLSLLGIPAIVHHGNTLSMEIFSEWKTPTYVLDGWCFKIQRDIIFDKYGFAS